ncbi:MAG: hypothetical protein LBS36_00900 [Oscillospiraceae bacterium]|jgi:hypothetical protein|nr:hypothetical protein [Oscillospiraceae bacterium]
MKKKFLSVLLVLSLVLSFAGPAFAQDAPAGYVTVSVDINTLGNGFLYEPVQVPFYEGESFAQITDRLLDGKYENSGSVDDGTFYMETVILPRAITVNIPQFILDETGPLDQTGKAEGETLGQFDYYGMSGWMITVNNTYIDRSAGAVYAQNGDVCRWQFTVYGYGADLGSSFMSDPMYERADKDALTAKVAQINSAPNKAELLAKSGVQSAYDAAYTVLGNLRAEQSAVDSVLTALNTALQAQPPASSVDISIHLSTTLDYMLGTVPAPAFGTGGGEWTVLSLARAGHAVPEGYFEDYYGRIEDVVTENNGILPSSSSKKTEYSRLIMALSSLGRDSTDVGGYDLTAWLSSMPQVQKQGINGPVFALIALDTNGYDIPDVLATAAMTGYSTATAADQVTRQRLIDYILDREIKKGTDDAGGFALSGTTPDPDMTAMVLQALAPYRSQPAVAGVITRAVTALSAIQRTDGGYASWGSVNAESIAQVIVALTALGVDPATDSRFVKEGNNPVTALLRFYVEGGGFAHILGSGAGSGVNGMATDQSAYALVAYDRFVKGKNSLYNMTDAFTSTEEPPEQAASIILEGPGQITGKAGTAFNVLVKTKAFPEGNFKLMDGLLNIPDAFSVENVAASDRLNGGALSWNYNAADKKLRFVYTNSSLENIGISGTSFPAELLTVTLKLKSDMDEASAATVSVGGLTLKEKSDAAAFVFDVAQAALSVAFSTVGVSVRELFTGDGVDLIPADKRAVAVTFSGIPAGSGLDYKGAELIFSPEMTAKQGANTYVLFTVPTEAAEELQKAENYHLQGAAASVVAFGDTDGNSVINAQDALDMISAWLRKTSVSTDLQILTYNVTSDARINTFDALAILEHYVSGAELAILSR